MAFGWDDLEGGITDCRVVPSVLLAMTALGCLLLIRRFEYHTGRLCSHESIYTFRVRRPAGPRNDIVGCGDNKGGGALLPSVALFARQRTRTGSPAKRACRASWGIGSPHRFATKGAYKVDSPRPTGYGAAYAKLPSHLRWGGSFSTASPPATPKFFFPNS